MKTHKLKTWPKYFKLIKSGEKRFEVRNNDRNFERGDILVLQEWHPMSGDYTGESISFEASHVLYGPAFGIEDGYCVMSLKPVSEG